MVNKNHQDNKTELEDNTEIPEITTEVQEFKVNKEVTEKKVDKKGDMKTTIKKEGKDQITDQRTINHNKLVKILMIHLCKRKL